jgi:hypothetical protein
VASPSLLAVLLVRNGNVVVKNSTTSYTVQQVAQVPKASRGPARVADAPDRP